MRDHADPFIGTGRAAERIGRRGQHDKAAIVHGAKLPEQRLGLSAGAEIGVRHHLGGFGRITLDGAVFQGDAGRKHKLVIGDAVAAFELDLAFRAIDIGRLRRHQPHAQIFQAFIIVRQRLKAQEATKIEVGKKAAAIDRQRFYQRNVKLGRAFLDVMRHRRAAGAPTDDDHPPLALGQSRTGGDAAGERSGKEALAEFGGELASCYWGHGSGFFSPLCPFPDD